MTFLGRSNTKLADPTYAWPGPKPFLGLNLVTSLWACLLSRIICYRAWLAPVWSGSFWHSPCCPLATQISHCHNSVVATSVETASFWEDPNPLLVRSSFYLQFFWLGRRKGEVRMSMSPPAPRAMFTYIFCQLGVSSHRIITSSC